MPTFAAFVRDVSGIEHAGPGVVAPEIAAGSWQIASPSPAAASRAKRCSQTRARPPPAAVTRCQRPVGMSNSAGAFARRRHDGELDAGNRYWTLRIRSGRIALDGEVIRLHVGLGEGLPDPAPTRGSRHENLAHSGVSGCLALGRRRVAHSHCRLGWRPVR